jgi:hypothetical protein
MGKIPEVWKMGATCIERQASGHRKAICEMLLQRFERKSFSHRIATGDEKWNFFENLKSKKSWPIVLAVRQCSVFGGTRMVWHTMNY